MQHLDEGTIHAWLDGELPSAEREELEAHVASCAQCAAAVAEARGFVAASSRILTALDSVPGGVLPKSDSVASKGIAQRKRFTVSRAWMAIAAVLVLSTVTVIARRPGQDDKLANIAFHQDTQPAGAESVQPAAPATGATATVNEPSAATSAAPSGAPLAKTGTNAPAQAAQATAGGAASTNAYKNDARAEVARKDVREKKETISNSSSGLDVASPAPALAVPPQSGPAGARARRETDALSDKPAAQVTMPSSPESALARRLTHERVRDSIRLPAPLASVVVTGEGATTNQKLGAPIAADSSAVGSAAPQLVSRKTSTYDEGDTVVTTVYEVSGNAVTLIDRSRASSETTRVHMRGSASQPSAKTLDTVPQVNSITWSDSSGHTRTLRGAVSREQLERIRIALFGATP